MFEPGSNGKNQDQGAASAANAQNSAPAENVSTEKANNTGINFAPQPQPVRPAAGDYLSNLIGSYATAGGLTVSLAKLKEEADKHLANGNYGVKCIVLDKTQIVNLKYSFMVFYDFKPRGDEFDVVFYVAGIAATGRDSLTAKETVAKAELVVQTQGKMGREELYTFSEIIDTNVTKIAIDQIIKQDNDVRKQYEQEKVMFTSMDGVVIPYETDAMAVIGSICYKAINAISLFHQSMAGNGLSLSKLAQHMGKNVVFKYNIETIKEGVISDGLGNPIKADFAVTLSVKDTSNQTSTSIHSAATDIELIKAYGYVTGLALTVREKVGGDNNPMGQMMDVMKIAPHIVITYIDTKVPDTSSALLGITCGALLGDNKQYIKVLLDTMTPERNPGLYSLITGIYTENGQPAATNLMDKNVTPDQRALVLDQLLTWTPIVSVDVHVYGDNYPIMSALCYANSDQQAAMDIVEAAKILTDNKLNYTGIPAYSVTDMPYGVWSTKHQQRDARDIELDFILQQTQGVDRTAIDMYLDSTTVNSEVSYENKLELMAQYLPTARVDGRIKRVAIDPELVRAIIEGLKASRIPVQNECEFKMPATGFVYDSLRGFGNYNMNFQSGIMYSPNPNFGGKMNFNSFRQYGAFRW